MMPVASASAIEGGLAVSMPFRRTLASVSLAVLTALVLATGALAAPPSWTAAMDIRVRNNLILTDADFSNHNVAVAWDEPDSPRRVGIRTSVNNGDSFARTTFLGGSPGRG